MQEAGIELLLVKSVVFVDQILPYDYTYKASRIEEPEAKLYYEKVNEYLRSFDSRPNIALHPQCGKCYMNDPWFNEWDLFSGITKELVLGSDIVVGHSSTALKWAKGKDIRLLWYKELDGELKARIERAAKTYNGRLVEI